MFDIHQSIYDKSSGEIDERRVQKYIDGLMKEFAASPEAQPVIQQFRRVGWAALMMEYAFTYIGESLPAMGLADFNEVVFDLFPHKVSTPAESAPAIVAELRAFWSFLHRQYGLVNALAILDTLTDDAERLLKKELANPANFGMAKSFVMKGIEMGFDMTTQEGVEAFKQTYNNALLAEPADALPAAPAPGEHLLVFGPELDSPMRHKEHEKKRKARKAQRQARKRNRK
jgi:hypothetical protein